MRKPITEKRETCEEPEICGEDIRDRGPNTTKEECATCQGY